MKKIRSAVLIVLFAILPLAANASSYTFDRGAPFGIPFTVTTNDAHYITAVYSLTLGDAVYDVSFDHSFGTDMPETIGLDPGKAMEVLIDLTSQGYFHLPGEPIHPAFANLYSYPLNHFQVALSDNSALEMIALAGYTTYFVTPDKNILASFRLVTSAVPETSSIWGFLAGGALLSVVNAKRRRRFSRRG
ncbi:PEP-CTERM sorting domain-containing protein [Oxalobacteraceae bacterium]|nr:PEP-CTERM sorting domain-containing protein [Oxalobacteraceae bacterium]